MSKFVGIDLGTTFSAISVLDDLGKPEIIPVDSDRITPSVVYFDEDDSSNVLVGRLAKNKLVDEEEAERVVQDVKREMGTNKEYKIDGKCYTPTQISSLIIKKLVQGASELKGDITEAVITVPANFSELERKATMAAGKIAGLTVKHIINEPTSAAVYYASQKPIAGNILIYDLGGGTFDVTIAKVDGQSVSVITSAGDRHLGGKDFDLKIVELFDKKYQEEFNEPLINNGNHQTYLDKAEEAKLNLSKKDRHKVKLKGSAGKLSCIITRDEYEEAISTYISKTELLIDSVLDEANMGPDDINQIILAGGSTRIPLVSKSIFRIFKKEPLMSINPDEAIAMGASIYAGLNADESTMNAAQKEAIKSVQLSEVTNEYYGTICLSRDSSSGMHELKNSIIIEKNTPLPCSNTDNFQTVTDGQTEIEFETTLCNSRETDPQFVRVIWKGVLDKLPPNRPAGQPIEITYGFDANQLMVCRYRDVGTNKELVVNLHPTEAAEVEEQKASVDDFLIE